MNTDRNYRQEAANLIAREKADGIRSHTDNSLPPAYKWLELLSTSTDTNLLQARLPNRRNAKRETRAQKARVRDVRKYGASFAPPPERTSRFVWPGARKLWTG